MKRTLILIALATLSLAACKKYQDVQPAKKMAKSKVIVKAQDTIPDQAGFKIRLAKDSDNRDETMISFDHTASINYSAANDALYFPGFGQVSLSSISGDGRNVAIYTLPYKPGMCIGLNVKTKTDGDYWLELSYAEKMPHDMHIWLRDALLKDSADVCLESYHFKVLKADTNSFGSRRFSLVLKQAEPQ